MPPRTPPTPLLDRAINEAERLGNTLREIRVSNEVPDWMLHSVILQTGVADAVGGVLGMVRRYRHEETE